VTPSNPARILIVEDDIDTADALRVLLESAGYAVLFAPDAGAAFEFAQREQPDLIIADVMMPSGTEGFHFIWKLRRDGGDPVKDVPIIVVSAIHKTVPLELYPEKSDGVYGPNEYLPVQAFLDKPIQPTHLLDEIERLLAGKGAIPGT
jgi:CheY-like chemotaxis protein